MMIWWLSVAFAGVFDPALHLELDAVARSHALEGPSGLEIASLRSGGTARPTDHIDIVGIAELAGDGKLRVFEAAAIARVGAHLQLSVGYDRTPLSASSWDQSVFGAPLPTRAASTEALWTGRDVGAQGWLRHEDLPVEAWLRVGNGTGSSLGNDDIHLAYQGRVDLTWGRGRHGATRESIAGGRVGVAAHTEHAYDRAGMAGRTPTGFLFWRAPIVSGRVNIGVAHARLFYGPLQAVLEGGVAREARAQNIDGNPDTPRETLDPVTTMGASAELAWMMTGQRRLPWAWPIARERDAPLAVELTGRFSRLLSGMEAEDLSPGGAAIGELGLRVWSPTGLAVAVVGDAAWFDRAPIETPDRTFSWGARARLTYALGRPAS